MEDTSAYQTWPPPAPKGGADAHERPADARFPPPSKAGAPNTDSTPLLEAGGPAEKLFHTPQDRGSVALSSFIFLGCALLAPWNSILSSSDYFGSAVFSFSVAYQSANIFGLALIVKWGERFSFRSRVLPGLVIYILCMVGLLAFSSKGVRIALVGVLGLVDALVQGAIFSLAAMLGGRYVGGVMVGQGVSGVVVSVLHIITKSTIDQDTAGIRKTTVIFFVLACVIVVFSMACYMLVVERSPVTKHFLDRAGRIRDARFERELNEREPEAYTTLAPDHYHNMQHSYRGAGATAATTAAVGGGEDEFSGSKASAAAVFRKTWPMCVAVFFVFAVTLACFPSLTVLLKSRSEHLNSTGWYVVIMVTLFDVGDLVGRSLPSYSVFANLLSDTAVYSASAVRVVFVPLFLFAIKNYEGLNNDAAQYVMMLVFSVSNGYGTFRRVPARTRPAPLRACVR